MFMRFHPNQGKEKKQYQQSTYLEDNLGVLKYLR